MIGILKFNLWHISLFSNTVYFLWKKCVKLAVVVVQSLLILVSLSLWSAWRKPMQGWGCHQKLKMWMWRKLEGKGCKESQPFGQSVQACSNSRVILTSSKKKIWWAGLQFLCNLNSPKNFPYPSGKLRTKLTGPRAKSTNLRVSDTPFFAHWSI